MVLPRNGDYIPLSELADMPDAPADLLDKLASEYGKVMVTDLDAMEGKPPQVDTLQSLPSSVEIWVNGGVRVADDLYDLFMAGAASVIASTRTLSALRELEGMLELSEHIVFEMALDEGMVPLAARNAAIGKSSPRSLVSQALAMGCRDIMITTVGSGSLGLEWLPEGGNFYIFPRKWQDAYAGYDRISGRILEIGEVLGIG